MSQPVTDRPNRLDEPRGRGIVAELAAEIRHVDVNEVVVADELRTPDPFEQRRSAHDDARITRECRQDPELGRGELDRRSIDPDFVSWLVDLQAGWS